MLDVCLLGTGGMMPLANRFLTSLLTRYNGSQLLIDCGEGTQVALRKSGFSANPIDIICFTHFHADHISGLPGLLLTMGNAERKKPLTIIGPKGITRIVESLRVIAPELPFEIEYIEITQPEQQFRINGYVIDAYKVNHNIICYGYSINIERQGKFDAQKAKELNIPLQYWNKLQKGNVIEAEGVTYTPDMVMGKPRKGIKLSYCTDTRPTEAIVKNVSNSDLFICEGMYGEADKIDKAKEHKHMTMLEAAYVAKQADVNEMWLTHYSPSMVRPEEFMNEVKAVFHNSVASKDGRNTVLKFTEEE